MLLYPKLQLFYFLVLMVTGVKTNGVFKTGILLIVMIGLDSFNTLSY